MKYPINFGKLSLSSFIRGTFRAFTSTLFASNALIAFADGAVLWTNGFNGPGNGYDVPNAIASDSAGNVWVAGTVWDGVSYNIQTIKYSAGGVALFSATYDGPSHANESVRAIAIDNSGSCYVAGDNGGTGSGLNGLTIKYDSTGVQQWINNYNGSYNGEDWLTDVNIDSVGNVIVAGATDGPNGFSDMLMLKLNPTSGVAALGVRYAATTGHDEAADLVVVGTTYYLSISTSSAGVRLVKYNSAFSQLYVKAISGSVIPATRTSVAIDSVGNGYVAVQPSSGTGPCRVYKYSATGVALWNQPIPQSEYAISIALDSANTPITLCRTSFYHSDSNNFHPEAVLTSMAPSGTLNWNIRWSPSQFANNTVNPYDLGIRGNMIYFASRYYGGTSGIPSAYYMTRFSWAGTLLSADTFGGPGNDSGPVLFTLEPGGNINLTGNTNPVVGELDWITFKISGL